MNCSPPGSSVCGILQERILEWVAMPFSRGSSQTRDQTYLSHISLVAGRFFTTSTTWEAPFNWQYRKPSLPPPNSYRALCLTQAPCTFFFFSFLFVCLFIPFFFNWRINALQYCIGFRHTSTWNSHGHIRFPSLLKPLPLGLSKSTGLSSPCHTAIPTCYLIYAW